MDPSQSDDSDLDEQLFKKLHITGNMDDYEITNAKTWNDEPIKKPSHENTKPRVAKRTVTCRYWARNDTCKYTSETCPFLHERAGVSDKDMAHTKVVTKKRSFAKLLKAFTVADLSLPDTSPRIENCKYVASYNLTDISTNTILVPGMFGRLIESL